MDDIKLKEIIINRNNYTDEYLISTLENLDDFTLAATYICKYTDPIFVSKIINNSKIVNMLDQSDYISLIQSLSNEEKVQKLMNEKVLFRLGVHGIFMVVKSIKNDNQKIVCLKNENLINMLEDEIVMAIIDSINHQNRYLISEDIILKKLSGSDIASFLNDYYTTFEVKNCLIKMLDKKKINFEKFIYIIKSTNIDLELKLDILNEFYPEKREYIKNKTLDEIILMIEEESINSIEKLDSKKSLEYIKKDLIESKVLINNIDNIMKIMLSNENISKELPKWFFEIILCSFSNEISLSNNNDAKCVVLSLGSSFGSYDSETMKIKLNNNLIGSTMLENIESLDTIFHENTHAIQFNKIKKTCYEYDLLRFTKDNILFLSDSQYIKYGNNYQLCSYESDARVRSYVDTYRYIKKINRDLALRIFEENYQSYVEDVRIRKSINRVDTSGNKCTLEELFDMLVSKDEIAYYVKQYPVLNLEYDDNGNKRDMESIQESYNYYDNKLKTLTIGMKEYQDTLKKYVFYRLLIDEKNKVLQNESNNIKGGK